MSNKIKVTPDVLEFIKTFSSVRRMNNYPDQSGTSAYLINYYFVETDVENVLELIDDSELLLEYIKNKK